MGRPALVVLGALAILAGAPAAADARLDRAMAAWAARGPDSYVYSYQKFCECHRESPPQTFVEIEADVVRNVYHVHPDSERHVPARDGSLSLYWTVPDLFSLIETAEQRGVGYEAEYDEDFGYPVRVYVDYDADAVGEEIDIRLTSFETRD